MVSNTLSNLMLRRRAPHRDDAREIRDRTPTLTVTRAADPRAPSDRLVSTLADELTAASDGVGFIYRALEVLLDALGAEDAAVVLEEPPLGRQVFRAGRRHLDDPWCQGLVRDGSVGLHVLPAAPDAEVADRVVRLCQLAIRLDAARYDAQHDPLTGLYNRRSFHELVHASAARVERYGSPFALVLLDLDGFKLVNDRLGHSAGDRVLRTLGAELHHRLRAGDLAARVGGDEFALLLPDSGHEIVDLLVARLERALNSQLVDLALHVSAGFAVAPDDSVDPTALYDIADRRLYASKAAARQ